MTLADSEGYTVYSLRIETTDSFWYQRKNRCADAPPNFNQSSFVVRCRAVLTELFGAQPAWLALQVGCQAATGLWSSLWHEVAPCSYYWYQSPWQEELRLQLSSDLPARAALGRFRYAWKPVHTSSRDLKICTSFSTVLMSETRRGFKFLFVQLSHTVPLPFIGVFLEVLGPGWTKNCLFVCNNLFAGLPGKFVCFYFMLFFAACLWYHGTQ